jgi:hypothetical protein
LNKDCPIDNRHYFLEAIDARLFFVLFLTDKTHDPSPLSLMIFPAHFASSTLFILAFVIGRGA